MATTSISLSPPDFLTIFQPKSKQFLTTHKPSLLFPSSITNSSKNTLIFDHPLHKIKRKATPIWRIYATSGEAPPLEAAPLESSEQIVSSTGDNGVATIISALLLVAFIGLSILTIGVIYIGVTDFLQKREREKFEKEEEAKKKKGGKKKKKVRARAGPRGFGQKIEDEGEVDD
ncbi:hypothetical protein UlMin_013389 [Ulmus minor]